MAKTNKKGPYLGFSWIVCVILAIFMIPNWLLGGIVRLQRDKTISGLIWLLTGGFFGIGLIIDLVTILFDNKIVLFA